MKCKKIIVAIGVFILWSSAASFAQQMHKGFDLVFVSGLNIGATGPVPIPKDLKLTSYNPKFNPKLGANLVYYFDDHWGVGTGLTLDWKGMKIHAKVTDVHLGIDVPDVGYLTGYVTGKGTTKVNTVYLTQPLYGVYRFNSKWQVKAGMYIAESLSRSFKGDVSNIKIVTETPVVREKEIAYATFSYDNHVRKFEAGILAGGEYRLNDHVGFYADFTWGLTPYFNNDVPMHFTTRNIYLSLGVTYRVKK